MNWFTYDFFDPLLPSEKWQSKNASPVPQYIQDLAVDLPKYVGIIMCNDWSTDDYIGGIKNFGSRVCVFRVCNGGRDNRGRPHRWVLLAAENELSQWRSFDVLDALDSPAFKEYATAPVPSPAPFPSTAPECRQSTRLNNSPLPDKLSIQGDDSERRIRDSSVEMTSGKGLDALLIVEKQKSQLQAWFQKIVPPLPLLIAQPKTQGFPGGTIASASPRKTSTASGSSDMKKSQFKWICGTLLSMALGAVILYIYQSFRGSVDRSGHQHFNEITEVTKIVPDANGCFSARLPSSVSKVQVTWWVGDDKTGSIPIEWPKQQSSKKEGSSQSPVKMAPESKGKVHDPRPVPDKRENKGIDGGKNSN